MKILTNNEIEVIGYLLQWYFNESLEMKDHRYISKRSVALIRKLKRSILFKVKFDKSDRSTASDIITFLDDLEYEVRLDLESQKVEYQDDYPN